MTRMKMLSPGFTLIELLIVIAIIGILAAVAIPYYEGYTIRARLIEVENAMANVQSAVSEYHIYQASTWPTCLTANEVTNSLGVSLGNIGRIGSISVTNGVITARVQNIHTLVDGKTITLRPSEHVDGSFSWAWEWSADFPMYLRQR